MFKIKNFTLTYDKPVLENVNFSFKSGEITVLTGTSGSEKSILLKVIKMVLFLIFNQLNYQVKLLIPIKVKICLIWICLNVAISWLPSFKILKHNFMLSIPQMKWLLH